MAGEIQRDETDSCAAVLRLDADDVLMVRRAGAEFRVVVCVCSDRELHRARLEGRERGIPGWHDAGNWANVERRLAEFPPWTGEVLTIDAVQPLPANLATVLNYVAG